MEPAISDSTQRQSPDPLPVSVDALSALDWTDTRARFAANNEFLFLDEFLSSAWFSPLADKMAEIGANVHRNYIPRHKKGGSVSRYQLDELAPEIAALYHDPKLLEWLEYLAGETLLPCPESDAHAYALYFYSQPGDHIGWHYDTSYYAGKRYTLLLGVVDESSSELEFELFRDDDERDSVHDARHLVPGALCFFNGDKVWHRITPLGDNERRISLTFEYVTDPHMSRGQRLISNLKDSIAYFGFRQVFSRRRRSAR